MAYSAVTGRMLSVIKAPPIQAPYGLAYVGAPPYSPVNNLVSNLVVFRARFIYDDNEKSAWGPTSDVQVYESLYYPNGVRTGHYYKYFSLEVDFDIPNDETLLSMEIAVRMSDIGAWHVVEEVDVTSYWDNTYTYTFLNDKVLVPVSDVDTARPFDYVPLLSGALEIIGGNDGSYLTLGDNTEGYDQVTGVTFASSLTSNVITAPISQVAVRRKSMTLFEVDTSITDGTRVPEIYVIGDGAVHRFTVTRDYWSSSAGAPQFMTGNDAKDYLAAQIQKLDIVTTATRDIGNNIEITFAGYYGDAEVIAWHYSAAETYGSLKGGANHYLGLVYRDGFGRRGPTYVDDDMKIYVPHACENTGDTEVYYDLSMTITHTPPEWAHSWELVYGETDLLWYQQFLVRTHDRVDKSVFLESDVIKLKINQGTNDVRNEYENYVYPNYVFTEGDRIRLVATRDRQTNTLTKAPSDAVYDNDIIGFDGVYISIPTWGDSTSLPDLDTTDDDLLFEIYRRKKESDDILYYGIGLDGSIINPGTPSRALLDASARTVSIKDTYSVYAPMVYLNEPGPYVEPLSTTTTTSTTTTFTDYYKRDQMGGVSICWHESKWQSAFVSDSKVSAKGEVHFRDEDARQLRVNNIRHSGIYVDKTFVNNLNRFDFDDDVALDDKNGRLNALKEVGYTLKALQRGKETSIYIGREMALDAEGNENIVYSSSVLGTKRPMIGDWGTVDPLSVLKTNRYLYYYDQTNGAMIRSGPGGQEEISKLGMEHYFRNFIGSADRVIAGHDREDDIIYFTLVDDDTPANNITLAFDENAGEGRGRWKTFCSFTPELYGAIGDKSFLSFVDGALWKHNDSSADRNNFYGGAYNSGIELIGNDSPGLIKTYEAFEEVGNQVWYADNQSEGFIVGTDRSLESADVFQMASYLRTADFVEYEGCWRAAFNMDLLTSTGVANNYDLYNGRQLKGHYISIRLKNFSTERVNLVLAKVISNVSK